MTKIEHLLKLFDEESLNDRTETHYVDRALFHLLNKWRDVLPELDYGFHKTFRQSDVISV